MLEHTRTRLATPFMLLTFMITITACGCQTTPRADALVDNLPPILARHDAYARALLSNPTQEQALQDSANIRDMFTANRGKHLPPAFKAYLIPVLDRHDRWVKADTTLEPVARTVYLNSSAAMRALFDIPLNR